MTHARTDARTHMSKCRADPTRGGSAKNRKVSRRTIDSDHFTQILFLNLKHSPQLCKCKKILLRYQRPRNNEKYQMSSSKSTLSEMYLSDQPLHLKVSLWQKEFYGPVE